MSSNYNFDDVTITAELLSGSDQGVAIFQNYNVNDSTIDVDLQVSCTTNEFDEEGNPNEIFGDSQKLIIPKKALKFIEELNIPKRRRDNGRPPASS